MYDFIFLRKQIVPRNIVQPFTAFIMFEHPGPFYELIGAQQEIDPHHRQAQGESSDEAKGYRIAPHVDGITDKAEPAIPTCTEDTGD